MAPFFPMPNLLLTDPPNHEALKAAWTEKVKHIANANQTQVEGIVRDCLGSIKTGSTIDLYETMKTLSWRIILAIFLPGADSDFTSKVVSLQETLLRGQFSLFPASVNLGLWSSPRSKGLKASQALRNLFRGHKSHPFGPNVASGMSDLSINHLLLATSSLAVKGLASLLTAMFLNIYFHSLPQDHNNISVHPSMVPITDKTHTPYISHLRTLSIIERDSLINAMMEETERLSPPVVGIMRRRAADVVLPGVGPNAPATLIPQGWDIWMYFVGASRDPATFGESTESLAPSRYLSASSDRCPEESKGLAFSGGAKTCLGLDIMRMAVKAVLDLCVEGVNFNLMSGQSGLPRGVRGWLGWETVEPKHWALDMKQLPTQRPIRPVLVEIETAFGPLVGRAGEK